jgi:hypothetical protein
MIRHHIAFRSVPGLLMVGILLSACLPIPNPAPTQSPLSAPTGIILTVTNSVPATKEPLVPDEVPTPGASYGVVTGMLATSDTPQSINEMVLFLGDVSGREDGFPIVAVDRQRSPKAFPSSTTGRFVFIDVPPGEYGLVYWDPDASFLVDRPDKAGESLIITVTPGSTQDVGVLQVPPH